MHKKCIKKCKSHVNSFRSSWGCTISWGSQENIHLLWENYFTALIAVRQLAITTSITIQSVVWGRPVQLPTGKNNEKSKMHIYAKMKIVIIFMQKKWKKKYATKSFLVVFLKPKKPHWLKLSLCIAHDLPEGGPTISKKNHHTINVFAEICRPNQSNSPALLVGKTFGKKQNRAVCKVQLETWAPGQCSRGTVAEGVGGRFARLSM